MKKYKEFINELVNMSSVFDDIMDSKPDNKPSKLEPMKKEPKIIYKSKAFKPRKFKGKKQTTWSKYIRSESELKNELKENLSLTKITLKGIIDLFSIHNFKLADNFQPKIPIKELYDIREYDRKLINGWTGKSTTKELNKLKSDLKKNGIKEYGTVNIKRLKNGDVTAILGEGNHRVKLAKELKIKEMPIMFFYGT